MTFPPIVSFEEMKRIEKEAFSNGVSLDGVMGEVAKGISDWIDDFISKEKLTKKISVFAGKGNNGADSLWAALLLERKGYQISIVLPFEQSQLCQKSKELLSEFKEAKICSPDEVKSSSFSVVVDGLLGIGSQGKVEEPLKSAVKAINKMKCKVVSVDIPSGLYEGYRSDEDAVRADYTLFVSLPKKCFFEKSAWEKVGNLIEITTPSFEPYYKGAKSSDYLILERCLDHHIESKRNQNKYEAGYLLLIAGSKKMQGAAKLTAEAAYRSGCGIIRLFGSPLDLAEVISEPRNSERFKEELKRASCICIGPGLGLEIETKSFVRECLEVCKTATQKPLILDADGLVILKELGITPPEGAILTPHYGELLKLLGRDSKEDQTLIFEAARKLAKEWKITLVCKGSPTRVFSPEGFSYFSTEGDPAMATAGMGDVLSGVLAGLLCRKIEPIQTALAGVYLHATASLQSLEKWGMFHLLASDCIKELGNRFLKFFGKR